VKRDSATGEEIEEDVLLREGALVAGRFRLESQISEGAMGTVWRATHIGLEVPCAVKFIHAHLFEDADLQLRFEREARAAASIRAPNVVQMLDYGVWEGTPYIVMELLDGEDLSKRLERRGRLSCVETIAILAQVARALAKAHAAGLVHRDLKPENIFLARDDDRELVKVLDFGIVRIDTMTSKKRVTRQGVMLGTPCYMSPEQAMGQRDIDLRSDLWSVAVVAYECLTGELPFVGDTVLDIAMNIISGAIPSPPVEAGLPPSFEAWWLRAVSRDRAARFSSANEQIEALAAAFALPKRSLLPQGRFSGPPEEAPPPLPLMLATTRPPEASFPDSGLARPGSSDRARPAAPRWKKISAVATIAAMGILGLFLLARRSPPAVDSTSALATEIAAPPAASSARAAPPEPTTAPEATATATIAAPPIAAPPIAAPSASASPPPRVQRAAAPPPSRYHWHPRPAPTR
jgi:serine/threonine-protein kinase